MGKKKAKKAKKVSKMKITGNEDGTKLSDEVVTEDTIKATAEANSLSEVLLFGSLEANVTVDSADFDKGTFQVSINIDKIRDIPTIEVSVDSQAISDDLFKHSKSSAGNRAGVLQFIRQGVMSAVTNAFNQEVFNEHLQILDEKVKSKTLEIQQANIEQGDLVRTEETPNLITSQADIDGEVTDDIKAVDFDKADEPIVTEASEPFEVTEVPQLEGGKDYGQIEEDDDDKMPEGYKPLSDGTKDSQPLKAEEDEEEGTMESVGKIGSHK